MPKVRRKCVVCGRDFWAKPKKLEDNLWRTPTKCQKCRNRERQKGQKRKGGIAIRDMGKIDASREVQQLIWLEHKHPKLVEKIRSREYGKKKRKDRVAARTKV